MIIIASTPAILLLRVLPSASNSSAPGYPPAPAQTIFNDNMNVARPVGSWHCFDVYGHMQFQLITDGPGFVVAKKSNPEVKVDVWHGVAYPRMVNFEKCVWVSECAGKEDCTKE